MKRITITVLLSIFVAVLSKAQVKISINVCPQINESFGARVGTDFDIRLNSRWSFVPGIYWSLRNRQTTNKSTTNGITTNTEYSDVAHFITSPLHLGFRIPCKDENSFALKLLFGPYIAYGIGGTSKYTENIDGKVAHYQYGAFDPDGRYKSHFDYGINVGINSLIKQQYKVGLFYEMGLRKIYNTNNVFEDVMGDLFLVNKINFALGLTLGYQF